MVMPMDVRPKFFPLLSWDALYAALISEAAVRASVPGIVTANSNVYGPPGTGVIEPVAVSWKQTSPEVAFELSHPLELSPPGISILQSPGPPGASSRVTEVETSDPVLNCMAMAVKKPVPALKPVESTVRNTSKVLPGPATKSEVAVYLTLRVVSVTVSAFATIVP